MWHQEEIKGGKEALQVFQYFKEDIYENKLFLVSMFTALHKNTTGQQPYLILPY